MLDNVRNYLYDKEYFIDIFESGIHVFRYLDLLKLTDTEINLQMEDFVLKIKGTALRVSKMNKEEIFMVGSISSLELER